MSRASATVIDDHPILRDGLVRLLETAGFHVRSAVGSVEDDGLDVSTDVILCDLQLPGRSGARAVRYLVGRGGTVLACSGGAKRQMVLDAIAAGARGYISKTAPAPMFVGAARIVGSGGLFMSAEAARYIRADAEARPLRTGDIGAFEFEVLRRFEQGNDALDVATKMAIRTERVQAIVTMIWVCAARRRVELMPTTRERAVMGLVASGRNHAEIAAELFIATATVPDHLRNIKAKYLASHPDAPAGISPKTAASAWAVELGLTWQYGSTEFRWSRRPRSE